MNEQLEYDVSIILPCFREEKFIIPGVAKIFEVMAATPYKFEVVFVDDASTDQTREKILKAAKKYPNVSYVFQRNNTGRGFAFINGVRTAKGRIIGYLDIDLEISISSLPKVIDEIEKGNDVVIVKRNYKIKWSFSFLIRHFASILYKRIAWTVLNTPCWDSETGFKFFRREALEQLLKKAESKGWFFDTEIMCLAHYSKLKIAQIDGIYKKNLQKISTVYLFSDSVNQFFQLIAYRKKLKKLFPR